MYGKLADMSKPTIFSVKHYDKTITIEIDHSDIDFHEVMETFESLTIAMGFGKDSFRNWVKEEYVVSSEELMLDRASLMDLSAKEMTVLIGGMRVRSYYTQLSKDTKKKRRRLPWWMKSSTRTKARG